jgi:GT2 family glycosyltransferase
MLLRTKMVREIGFLDKNMRFICSDSDYSFTARARGWKVKVSHMAHLYHSSGSSDTVADGFISRVKCEDAIYFANKWLTGDLYRSLAFEGDRLTRMRVQTAVENLKNSAKSK